MKNKKAFLIIGALAVAVVLAAGGVYAGNSNHGDVSTPEATPDTNIVKFHMLGTSMDPTIKDGDWLLAATEVKNVQRGSLVILRYPKDTSKIYCRRVVAVAGDRVVMKYYSNVKLTTIYSSENPGGVVFPQGVAPNGNAYGEYDAAVTPGKFYVVGDNTVPGGSFDSDEWGLLPSADVVGVVTKRLTPNPRAF